MVCHGAPHGKNLDRMKQGAAKGGGAEGAPGCRCSQASASDSVGVDSRAASCVGGVRAGTHLSERASVWAGLLGVGQKTKQFHLYQAGCPALKHGMVLRTRSDSTMRFLGAMSTPCCTNR